MQDGKRGTDVVIRRTGVREGEREAGELEMERKRRRRRENLN